MLKQQRKMGVTTHLGFLLVVGVVCAMLVSACGGAASSGTGTTTGSTKPLTKVSIGLGYNPDIQFAPFYVALNKGYYRDAGLDVTLNHGIVTDLIGTMVAGKSTFVFASGDELLEAHDKDTSLQAVDVATIFQRYPVSIIVPADSAIKSIADLKGHSLGEPGPYGATYTGALALLHSAGLTANDVKLQSVGYNQVAALSAHKVDAVVGYSNNEPLQLASNGMKVRTFDVSDYQPLVSNGIMTTTATYNSQPQMVRNFVQATLKGLRDVIANPDEAVTISESYVPGMNVNQAKAVLAATIPIFKGNGKLGYNDAATWDATAKFLASQKLIGPVQNVAQFYTNKDVQ
jgi:ABC-type nitrate/sulfonate/bicarbonate transport systems, periplasmic components